MRALLLLTLALGAGHGLAQELPAWAQEALRAAEPFQVPEGAAVWTLLDRTRITRDKDGSWLRSRQVVHRVLQQRGGAQAASFTLDGAPDTSHIESLRGWHRRAAGGVERLDRQRVATYGELGGGQLHLRTRTVAGFERVGRGDIVAFESLEREANYFNLTVAAVFGDSPVHVRRFELVQQAQDQAVIQPVAFDEWGLKAIRKPGVLEILDVPARANEALGPDDFLAFPYVILGFQGGEDDPMRDWGAMARWYANKFRNCAETRAGLAATEFAESLTLAAKALADKISYRQVYLTSARGWEPLAGAEVERRAYGDCKDMVAYLAYRLDQLGLDLNPALCHINSGYDPSPVEPVQPNAFNHVIAAIPLAHTLGFAAEVEADGRRWLLHDPTDRYTPLGQLGLQLRGRTLMICDDAGAHWVTLTDAAVQRADLELRLLGKIDGDNGLEGRLRVEERGDAIGLRTQLGEGNLAELLAHLREALALPGVVDLVPEPPNLDSQGVLTLECAVLWPSFLRRNAGGLKLPAAVTGGGYIKLETMAARQQPVWIPATTPTRWHLELDVPFPLKAFNDFWQWQDPFSRLSWQAQPGRHFVCDFSHQRQRKHYGPSERLAGLTAWYDYVDHYARFLINATCFF